MTTGATQAPASSAAMAPMLNASQKVPRLSGPNRIRLDHREKSSDTTSNIARPSTTNSTAIATLNQADELIAPNVPAVKITTNPSTPYTSAMAPPYVAPRTKPRPRFLD